VTDQVPDVLGVPESTPDEESASPEGRLDPLASVQMYGLVPPEAASVVE
jgi:hypothetical protein